MPVFNFIKRRIDSVGYALNGVFLIIRTQHNAWIHTLMTFTVIILGFAFQINFDEWMFLVLAIMSVWVSEGLNTALECLSDSVTPEYHPLIGKAKDVAAGAVLIAASGATVIGCIVFLPRIFAFF